MRWTLTADGHEHVVTISGSSFARMVDWQMDGRIVATKSSSDDRVGLSPEDETDGSIGLRFGRWSVDARRVTLMPGEIDFIPEPGSAAERREARIRRHPWRHTLILTAAGVLKVVVPILLGLIAIRFALTLPWPSISLPSIPWPDWDLPSIPWPSIPWPSIELPNLTLPGWIRDVLSKAKYVWPILLAFVLARAEVRRRRQQDALRKDRESLDHSGPGSTTDLG